MNKDMRKVLQASSQRNLRFPLFWVVLVLSLARPAMAEPGMAGVPGPVAPAPVDTVIGIAPVEPPDLLPPVEPGFSEILVDDSGLHHIVASDPVNAAWGEGCVDADSAWPAARLHLLLTAGFGSQLPNGDSLWTDPAVGWVGTSLPMTLRWSGTGQVEPSADGAVPTMADLQKTLLFLNVPQNAQAELESLSDEAMTVLQSYVDGFNECFHRDAERWMTAYPFIQKYGLHLLDLTPIEVLSRMNYFWAWGNIPGIQKAVDTAVAMPRVRPAELDIPPVDYDGASNSWYISARFMADGRTVHATDPHIPIMLPGPYGIAFRSVVGQYAGAGLLGTPGMLLGVTTGDKGNVAWTVTASGPDGSDIYDVTTFDGGGMYRRSNGSSQPFALLHYQVGGDVFTIRTGQYGRVFYDHPNFPSAMSLKAITEAPLRTFEWSRAMNSATSMDELKAALVDADGIPRGIHGLNLLATANRPDADVEQESAYYALLGRVPKRAGDDEDLRDYAGILNAMDPANEWLDEFYTIEELPQSDNPLLGYAANCNVSPGITDWRIGNKFPLSIVYSPTLLSTWRQVSFNERIDTLVDTSSVTQDELLAFATSGFAPHWNAIMDVLLLSFLAHGDPFAEEPLLTHEEFQRAQAWIPGLAPLGADEIDPVATDEIPLGWRVASIVLNRRLSHGLEVDDDYISSLMHAYTFFLGKVAENEGDAELAALAGDGRPLEFTELSTWRSTHLAFQAFFDTIDWFIATYDEDPPTMKGIIGLPMLDGNGYFVTRGTTGGGGSFRASGGPTGLGKEDNKLRTTVFGGSAFYQLSRIGGPGDVQVHLLKPYTSWDRFDQLGTVMPKRFAEYEFTDVQIPPLDGNVVRRIAR